MHNIDKTAIKAAIAEQIKGLNPHLKMVPTARINHPPLNMPKPQRSAVMLLFFKSFGTIKLCLTRRSKALKHHAGQISFPGGRCEKHEEENPLLAALRETNEEIGISPEKIEVLGQLSEVYVYVSNFIVHPYLGWIDHEPQFYKNHNEVEEIIALPVEDFLKPEHQTITHIDISGGSVEAPCYQINGYTIWGATSMMIAELEAKLRQYYSRRVQHSGNVDNVQEH